MLTTLCFKLSFKQITRICFSASMFEARDQNIRSMSLLLRMEGSDSQAATGLAA